MVLEGTYFPHFKEANLISRKSVKIYLYCLDSQMFWKSFTPLMPTASTGDNERIYRNELSRKMMHTPLPQSSGRYYDSSRLVPRIMLIILFISQISIIYWNFDHKLRLLRRWQQCILWVRSWKNEKHSSHFKMWIIELFQLVKIMKSNH